MDVVYTVKSGDWLAKIAEEHGTTVSAIWNHPGNAEHRAKRGSPDVLYPGDVLVVPSALAPPPEPPPPEVPPPPAPPEVPPEPPALPWPFPPPEPPPPSPLPSWSCAAGICVCHAPDDSAEKVPHTIVLYDPGGHRMPGARCMIYERGRAITSPTTAANGAGEIEVELAPHTRSLWVEWCPAALPAAPGMPFRKLYHVALDGDPVTSRLSNLGFTSHPQLSENVSSYQRSQGLDVTGRPDDVEDDLQARHDGGTLLPFAPSPHADQAPPTADTTLASFFAAPPALNTPLDLLGDLASGAASPQGGGGGGGQQGAVVPNVGQLLVVVGLEPDHKAIEANAITLRLLPRSVSGLQPGAEPELIKPTASAIPWEALPNGYVLFAFANVRAGAYTALAHVGGIKDAHRGYALGSVEVSVKVGLLTLSYVPVTRERVLLTVDDPLLELDVEAMQRRRKVLATVFAEFPQSADKATAPLNMPPYLQGAYKAMLPGLDSTNTCAPINTQTMGKAGARGHEFGFGQVTEIKNEDGKTTGVQPRIAFVRYKPGLAPSVGDCFLGTDKAGFLHHCGIVVRSSPHYGELWFTADGGQPDRTSPFQERDDVCRRFYGPPHFSGSREAAYIVARRLSPAAEDRARLGNRFIFPGLTKPGGDYVYGWTDITHPTVSFRSAYTKDFTHQHFRAMQQLVRDIGPRVEADLRRAEAEEILSERI